MSQISDVKFQESLKQETETRHWNTVFRHSLGILDYSEYNLTRLEVPLFIPFILTFERKCHWKVPSISGIQKVTNEEIFSVIRMKGNLLQIVIERKLQLCGHLSNVGRSVNLWKMDGSNNRGRPRATLRLETQRNIFLCHLAYFCFDDTCHSFR